MAEGGIRIVDRLLTGDLGRCIIADVLAKVCLTLLLLLLLSTRPVAATKTGNPKSQYRNPKQIRNPKPPLPAKRPRAGPKQILTSSMPLRPPFSLPPFLPSSFSPTFLCFEFRIVFQICEHPTRENFTRPLPHPHMVLASEASAIVFQHYDESHVQSTRLPRHAACSINGSGQRRIR